MLVVLEDSPPNSKCNLNIDFNDKTNKVEKKKISTLSFMTRIEKLHNIKDLYSLLYKDELNVYSDSLDLRNPSSGNPTSVFK